MVSDTYIFENRIVFQLAFFHIFHSAPWKGLYFDLVQTTQTPKGQFILALRCVVVLLSITFCGKSPHFKFKLI